MGKQRNPFEGFHIDPKIVVEAFASIKQELERKEEKNPVEKRYCEICSDSVALVQNIRTHESRPGVNGPGNKITRLVMGYYCPECGLMYNNIWNDEVQ